MFDDLSGFFQSGLSFSEAIVPIGFSLLAAIIVNLMYIWFYGSKNIGAGVNRTFLIGGPSVTVLFLGIQSSIPLSLGLLGALSFVRFRTPVKDPAEIGFLLLLITSSIGAATENYLIVVILFIIVFIALLVQALMRSRFSPIGRANMIIGMDQLSFQGIETNMNNFLKDRLNGLKLQTMSVVDGRVSLHYQYNQKSGFDVITFTRDLKRITDPADIEVFMG